MEGPVQRRALCSQWSGRGPWAARGPKDATLICLAGTAIIMYALRSR